MVKNGLYILDSRLRALQPGVVEKIQSAVLQSLVLLS
jgi:hypothetical protein